MFLPQTADIIMNIIIRRATMGERITFSCGQCGYELTAPVGFGLASFNPAVIGGLLEGGEREEWKVLSDSGKLEQCFGEQVMASCEECKGLFNVFCVTGRETDGTEHIWGVRCPQCGRNLKLLRDIQTIACPQCRSILKARQTGLWD